MLHLISGDRDCGEIKCGLPGQCIDVVVNYVQVTKQNLCIGACKEEPLCSYWTYNTFGGQCSMYSNCSKVDTVGCPDCFYGEQICPKGILSYI